MKVYILSEARKTNDKHTDWERPVPVGAYSSMDKAIAEIRERTHGEFSPCLSFVEPTWMSETHMYFVTEMEME